MSAPEEVVLLDEVGRAVGSLDKQLVHHAQTPLHLAFSCYVFDGAGSVLVSRRALAKQTFAGVWTNSCCGHPAPGESIENAVHRRVGQELGLTLEGLTLLLPDFRYTAEQDGVVENEMCPVFVATTSDDVRPDPAEVEATVWEPWPDFRDSVLAGRDVSVWCREQVVLLPEDPLAAVPRPRDELPPAAR